MKITLNKVEYIVTVRNENITMVRGDTLAFDMLIDGVSTLETAYFTAKGDLASDTAIFQKAIGDGINKIADGEYSVRVAPEDTAGVESGKYYYDLQIGFSGDVYTIQKGILEIEQDVTGATTDIDGGGGQGGAVPITFEDIDTITSE